jgi:Uroporphyrinogen decarboxylase (URO-D)
MTIQMVEAKGPTFDDPLVTPDDIGKLTEEVDIKKKLGYVMDAITLTRHELKGRVPLFGFVGGPWTLLGYMIEGGGSKTFTKAKSWLYKYPEESKELLQKITDIAIDFLAEQIIAGAQAYRYHNEKPNDRSYKFSNHGQENYRLLTSQHFHCHTSYRFLRSCIKSFSLEDIIHRIRMSQLLSLRGEPGMRLKTLPKVTMMSSASTGRTIPSKHGSEWGHTKFYKGTWTRICCTVPIRTSPGK